MTDKSSESKPLSAIYWWLFGAIAVSFLTMWGYAGLYRTLWWLGLLLGSIGMAFVTSHICNRLKYSSNAHEFVSVVVKIFVYMAGLILLFGVLISVKVILSPFSNAFSNESSDVGELPDNWRR